MNLDNIQLIHNYARLARQGFVAPLTHSCGTEYSVRLVEDEVKFQCFTCGTVTDPGRSDTKAMEAAIADYKAKRA